MYEMENGIETQSGASAVPRDALTWAVELSRRALLSGGPGLTNAEAHELSLLLETAAQRPRPDATVALKMRDDGPSMRSGDMDQEAILTYLLRGRNIVRLRIFVEDGE